MTAVAPALAANFAAPFTRSPYVSPRLPSPPRRPSPRPRLEGAVPARLGRPRRAVYWRRRVAVAVLAATALVGLATGAGAVFGGAAPGPARGPAITHYTVQPGDTLWKIARHLEPGHDPREVVDLLAAARHTTVVMPGEVIDWAGM